MGALGISKELFANAAYMYAVKSPQLLLVRVRVCTCVRILVFVGFCTARCSTRWMHDEHVPSSRVAKQSVAIPIPVPGASIKR